MSEPKRVKVSNGYIYPENLKRHQELLKKKREKENQQLRDLIRLCITLGKDPAKIFESALQTAQ